MSEKSEINRSPAATGLIRRRQRRLFVLAGAILLLACLFGAWLLRGWRGGEELEKRLPPDYVPEDSEIVLAVNVRQMLATLIGRQHLGPFFQQLSGQAKRELPWLEWTGIKPIDDIDTLLISFAPGAGVEPLWLARGRIDRSRFQIGPKKLQEKNLDHFRVWEYRARLAKQTMLLAVIGDTLVVSQTPGRVQAALKQASDPQPIHVRDAMLRDMLAKVDRRQSLWLAASIKNLRSVAGIDNYLLKMVLRPLLAHAESVYGGISCAEDLQATLHFDTATEEEAIQLETDLKNICAAAPGAALLGQQNELLPLLRLLGAGQIRREGKTILFSSRLTADQLIFP